MQKEIDSLNNQDVNITTFQAMQTVKETMKNQRGNIDADEIADMLDDLEEERDISDQISGAFAPNLDIDEEDAMAELDAFLKEDDIQEQATQQQKQQQQQVPQSVFNLPTVPEIPKSTSKQKEEDQMLKELQSMMS